MLDIVIMKAAYTSTEVQKLFGIGRPVFQAWLGDGILDPSITRSQAQGEPNIFSDADVVRIGVMALLTRQGYPRNEAKIFLSGIDAKLGRQGYLTSAFILMQSSPLKSTVVDDEGQEHSTGGLFRVTSASDMQGVLKSINEKFEITEIINLKKIRAEM